MKHSSPSRSEPTPKTNKTLLLDRLVLVWNPPLVHVSFSGPPSRATLEKLGPPRLFRGERARHLTIPLDVRCHGALAGRLDIHLTYGYGRGAHHETVVALDPKTIAAALEPLGAALGAYYRATARMVTINELRREGYVVALLTEDAEAWLDERARANRWVQRVTESKLDKATEESLEFFDVEILNELRDDPRYQPTMAVREADGFTISVGYQSRGVGPDRPPGWYAMPIKNEFSRLMDDWAAVAVGPAFYESMLVIARELQAPMDVDALLADYARALSGETATAPSEGSPIGPLLGTLR